jgi:hypothetical protein
MVKKFPSYSGGTVPELHRLPYYAASFMIPNGSKLASTFGSIAIQFW